MTEYLERNAAVMRLMQDGCSAKNVQTIMALPAVDVEKISDGYHTFEDLYEQRLILSAALAKNNPHAWKSKLHEDGSVPFGGGWFVMGFDTEEGCYTYHYELKDWDLFQCKELEKGKPWDGHTSKDVRRLLSLPNVFVSQWISVKERLPKVETEVLVTCNRNGYRFVCPAIYEDGTVLTQESTWNWYDLDGTYSEEDDDYFVPQGWWENRQFMPYDVYNSPIDCAVTDWMPLPNLPKKEGADNG